MYNRKESTAEQEKIEISGTNSGGIRCFAFTQCCQMYEKCGVV